MATQQDRRNMISQALADIAPGEGDLRRADGCNACGPTGGGALTMADGRKVCPARCDLWPTGSVAPGIAQMIAGLNEAELLQVKAFLDDLNKERS